MKPSILWEWCLQDMSSKIGGSFENCFVMEPNINFIKGIQGQLILELLFPCFILNVYAGFISSLSDHEGRKILLNLMI